MKSNTSAISPPVLSKYESQNELRFELQALTTKFNLHFYTISFLKPKKDPIHHQTFSNLFLVFLFFFTQVLTYGQGETQEIATEIEQVSIHLKGAEIIREKSIKLTTGRHTLVFTGLSTKLNPKSVLFTANQSIQILSVTNKIIFFKEGISNPEIDMLRDFLEMHELENQLLEAEKSAYETEKQTILSNQKIEGNQSGLSLDELQKMEDFVRNR